MHETFEIDENILNENESSYQYIKRHELAYQSTIHHN